ncbi:MAG: hypothetical protein K8W52_14745 [Deltaproteobacteria bacterium]|nr:hypothetical protein [Deltaproteobacteria bacterium]
MARWPSVRVALIIAAGVLGLAAISLVNALSGPGAGSGDAPPDAAIALDAAPTADAAPPAPPAPPPTVWPELADRTIALPSRVVELPIADPDRAETSSSAPLVMGDLAIVATARAGFVAVDLPTATVRWARPAGAHVAPPAALGDHVVLLGDCTTAPPPVRGQVALGCFDIVDPRRITDTQAGVVSGPARDLAAFATATGEERTAVDARGALIWRRGAIALAIDLATGAAHRLPAPPIEVVPHIDLDYHGDHWTYAYEDGVLIGRFVSRSDPQAKRVERWRFDARGAVMAGAFGATPPRVPIVRLAGGRGRRDPDRPANKPAPRPRTSYLLLLDIDAVAGELGQVSRAFPGERALSAAFGEDGLTAVAVRLPDNASSAGASAPRDYVALFDGNALFLWAYPLPESGPGPGADRPAPGLAIDRDTIVVLSDDRLALIPVVPDSPTVPPGPSQNPTP